MAPETSPDAFRELVLAVACEHPQVVTNGDLPPTVLYRAASDTGLEFALWCVIRDVERRPFVLSELLYALEPRLLAAGLKRGH
jgi:small-conductance mechanosensitive channel